MSVIHLSALPLPHYICSGFSTTAPGRKHPERHAIGEFDLLVVIKGCLYIGEEDWKYEVAEGHALILRPDLHHYPYRACEDTTLSFWLHFQTAGHWSMVDESREDSQQSQSDRPFRMQTFNISILQFTRLLQPTKMYDLLRQISDLEKDSHLNDVRWRQQLLFQEILMQLSADVESTAFTPGSHVADQAASYLREHYSDQLPLSEMGDILNFHPVYIARCMKKHLGYTPTEYLTRYRLEQAKFLLLQSDLPVNRIADEVGFQQAAYFTSCFRKYEGLTPRAYRKRYFI